MRQNEPASWLRWVALGILAIYAAFWALFAAGEIMAGEWGGAVYFISTLLVLGLMFWCWKSPLTGGLVSLLVGILLMARFYTMLQGGGEEISAAVVIGGPFVIAGAVCLLHSVLNRSHPEIPSAEPAPPEAR